MSEYFYWWHWQILVGETSKANADLQRGRHHGRSVPHLVSCLLSMKVLLSHVSLNSNEILVMHLLPRTVAADKLFPCFSVWHHLCLCTRFPLSSIMVSRSHSVLMILLYSEIWAYLSISSRYVVLTGFLERNTSRVKLAQLHPQVLVASEVTGLIQLGEMARDSIQVGASDLFNIWIDVLCSCSTRRWM